MAGTNTDLNPTLTALSKLGRIVNERCSHSTRIDTRILEYGLVLDYTMRFQGLVSYASATVRWPELQTLEDPETYFTGILDGLKLRAKETMVERIA
jgi:hypothetical protein